MNHHERYREAYDTIRESEGFRVDLDRKLPAGRRYPGGAVAAVLAVVLMLGGVGTVYAANVAGLRTTVRGWFQGTETDANILVKEDGNYEITYTDASGNPCTFYTEDAPNLDPEEVLADVMQEVQDPDLYEEEDGHLVLYWRDQRLDITDLFVDGVCHVTMTSGDETMYITARLSSGEYSCYYTFSTEGFPDADKLIIP